RPTPGAARPRPPPRSGPMARGSRSSARPIARTRRRSPEAQARRQRIDGLKGVTAPTEADRSSDDPGTFVEFLQQVVGSAFHRLVPPLGRAVDARDQAGSVHTPEVSRDEGVPGLRLLVGAIGEAEVPRRVVAPA